MFDSIVKENDFGEKHTENPLGWIFQNSDLQYEDVLAANDLEEMLPEIQEILKETL